MRVTAGVAALVGAAAMAAPAQAWQPEPASFGVGEQHNVPVQMADGTTLRVDLYVPTNSDGTPAQGPFPVVMTQSPYGKDAALKTFNEYVVNGLPQTVLIDRQGVVRMILAGDRAKYAETLNSEIKKLLAEK